MNGRENVKWASYTPPDAKGFVRDVTIRVTDNFTKTTHEFSIRGMPSEFVDAREAMIEDAHEKLTIVLGKIL